MTYPSPSEPITRLATQLQIIMARLTEVYPDCSLTIQELYKVDQYPSEVVILVDQLKLPPIYSADLSIFMNRLHSYTSWGSTPTQTTPQDFVELKELINLTLATDPHYLNYPLVTLSEFKYTLTEAGDYLYSLKAQTLDRNLSYVQT
jgi:hypothetical protein